MSKETKTREKLTTIRGASIQQLLAMIGHAPPITNLEKLEDKVTRITMRPKSPDEIRNTSKHDVVKVKTKWLDGKTLIDYLNSETDEDRILEIAKQLGSIMGFLHKNGITHGDLHSKNIIVTKERMRDVVKIVDLESANLTNEGAVFIRRPQDQDGNVREIIQTGWYDIDIIRDWEIITESIKGSLKKSSKTYEILDKFKDVMWREYEREIRDKPFKFRGHSILRKIPKVKLGKKQKRGRGVAR